MERMLMMRGMMPMNIRTGKSASELLQFLCQLTRRKLFTIVPSALDKVTFLWYIIVMKARNIINANNEDSPEPFAVYQHITLRNGWEYYLEEEDSYGLSFGYVMGFANEWGMVDMAELKPHIASIARGKELQYVMSPFGYYWEDEKVEEVA